MTPAPTPSRFSNPTTAPVAAVAASGTLAWHFPNSSLPQSLGFQLHPEKQARPGARGGDLQLCEVHLGSLIRDRAQCKYQHRYMHSRKLRQNQVHRRA